MIVRRKCFISYHHADEQTVSFFVSSFSNLANVFIVRRLGQMADDIVNSTDTDYVMRRIREDYIGDSTVTLLMAGAATWSRRYVDWEIQASLRQSGGSPPNGLLGIKLPGFTRFPERFDANVFQGGYAGYIDYPANAQALRDAVEWAFNRRTTYASKIVNPRERFAYNKQIP
jgi:hypothetical protein